eukprot:s395_g11.t1
MQAFSCASPAATSDLQVFTSAPGFFPLVFMSKEHLRPQYGMVITSDGTALRGSKEPGYEPSAVMALLAGRAMQLMKQRDDEAASSEKKPFANETLAEETSVASSSAAATVKPKSQPRKKKGRSGKSSK